LEKRTDKKENCFIDQKTWGGSSRKFIPDFGRKDGFGGRDENTGVRCPKDLNGKLNAAEVRGSGNNGNGGGTTFYKKRGVTEVLGKEKRQWESGKRRRS